VSTVEPMRRTLVIGLTGGIGVGKSTVSSAMARRGAVVVDVDGLGRQVLEPAGSAYSGVVGAFGETILDEQGRIDRARLAEQVFGSTNRLDELEAISHPAINEELRKFLASTNAPLVVLDMAVLTESRLGWHADSRLYQRVMVVEAPTPQRLERLERRGMAEADVRARIGVQVTDLERRQLADLIVVNDGSVEDLEAELDLLWPTIEAWQTQ
jgi:dephospho-CoA kinase